MRLPWIVKKTFRTIRKYVRGFWFKNWDHNNEFDYLRDRKTVLVVSHSSREGGAPMLLGHIAEEMRIKGYQVIIVSCDYGPMLNTYSKFGKVYVCLNAFQVNKLIKKLKKEYCIEKCYFNSVMSGNVVKHFKKESYHTISLVHELPYAIESLHASRQAQNTAEYSDVLVFAANYVMNKFQEVIYPTRIDNKAVIQPQGIYQSVSVEIDKRTARKTIEQRIGITNISRIVLNVGEPSYRKGFDLFVNLAKIDPNSIYLWVGYRDNAFSKKTLTQIGNKLDNLRIIGYITDTDELYEYYCASDVFCLTSREEPFASVVLEAFNVGLPVIAFANVGGADDIVKNGVTGFLAETINPDIMLKLIDEITADKENYDRISSNCKNIAGCMSFSDYVDRLLEL